MQGKWKDLFTYNSMCEALVRVKEGLNCMFYLTEIHAIFFIRNTVEFQLVLFLKFPPNWTSFVAYLLLNFLKIFHSLFLRNMFFVNYLSILQFYFTA